MIYKFVIQGECKECDLLLVEQLGSINIDSARGVVLVDSALPSQEIVDALNLTLPGRFVLVSTQTSVQGETSVCLFEHFQGMRQEYSQFDNRGICRLTTSSTAVSIDLSVSGLAKSTRYRLDVNEYGDLAEGCASTGGLFMHLCELETDADGFSVFTRNVNVVCASLIGRALVVSRVDREDKANATSDESICGIIARSAGILQNDKKICSCSGKTIWEERATKEI